MLFNHIPFDMVYGMYGVPLFYPLSKKLYMLPPLELNLFGRPSNPLVSKYGMALLIYFGTIAFFSLIFNALEKTGKEEIPENHHP